MLDMLTPATSDPDALDDFAAAVGAVQTVAEQDFTGGYAETAEQTAERLTQTSTPTGRTPYTRAQRGLGDVILTLPREDKDELNARIMEARRKMGLTSSGEVVLRCMRAWTMQSGSDR